jgi:hypothetical protein
MKKILILLSLILLCSCTPALSSTSNRSEIVGWARELSNFEKRAEILVDDIQPLMLIIVKRPPTPFELNQLNDFSNAMTSLYNQLLDMNPPKEARAIHNKYIESYAKSADFARFYVLSIRENNIDFFNLSTTAVQDANRIGADAYIDFANLLEEYSISCSEIDFCE